MLTYADACVPVAVLLSPINIGGINVVSQDSIAIEMALGTAPISGAHTSAYGSIRQHTSAYVSIRQHMRSSMLTYADVCGRILTACCTAPISGRVIY
jgi:hypothetical protein